MDFRESHGEGGDPSLPRGAGVSLCSILRPPGCGDTPMHPKTPLKPSHAETPPYLRQPGDLDEPLEIQHVGGFLKEAFEAGRGKERKTA